MSIENVKNALPEYAKDIKLNLSGLANEETLTVDQFWGCMAATALAGRNEFVIQEILEEAAQHLSPETLEAAKAAAAIMAMNNVYYKFTGMIKNEEYKTMPAKLRMNILAGHGADKTDFELWSLAVSAVNGCKFCVDSHEKKVRGEGLSAEQVQASVRVAAVVQAASAIMDGEMAMSDNLSKAA